MKKVNGWRYIKIKDFTNVVGGGTPRTNKKENYENGSVSWITPADLTNYNKMYIKKGKRNITKLGLEKSSAKLLPKDTVLFSSRAPIGHVAIAGCELATNQGFKSILPSEEHDSKYIYYYLKANKHEIEAKSPGTTFKEISGTMVKELKIPLPPVEEQKCISEILDKAQSLIDKKRESINKLENLISSTFLSFFGDPLINPHNYKIMTLGVCCDLITDGTHNSPPPTEYGMPYITAKHVGEHKVDFNRAPSFIAEEEHKKIFKRCPPERGDVLYIKDGATTGKAAVNPYDFEFSMLSSLALIKTNKDLLSSEYLTSYLNLKHIREHLVKGVSGVAIKRFTLNKIKRFKLPIPSIETQKRFSNIYCKYIQMFEKEKKSLRELEYLYQSLLQRAFNGELTKEKSEVS